jgi:phosphoribosyl 1,2-cyclic phosphodiesterase
MTTFSIGAGTLAWSIGGANGQSCWLETPPPERDIPPHHLAMDINEGICASALFVAEAGRYSPHVPARFTILGSGSNGNCAYLETESARLLIDAGFSARQIRQRLAGIGRCIEALTGILITHEHGDHVQGLAVLAEKLDVPIYCNRLTREAIEGFLGFRVKASIFQTGATFDIGEVTVESFSVPHDAYDPVGFLFRTPSGNVGFLTDLGHATKLVLERVRPAHVLVLEANHDMKLLQEDTRRPWSTKQRILSRHGHLSNSAAAEVAVELASSHLRRIYLGHLSRDCNRPELALRTVSGRLHDLGITQMAIENTHQEAASPTMELA